MGGGRLPSGKVDLCHFPCQDMPNVRISQEEILVLGGGSFDGRLSSAELLNIVEGTSTLFESMAMQRMYV